MENRKIEKKIIYNQKICFNKSTSIKDLQNIYINYYNNNNQKIVKLNLKITEDVFLIYNEDLLKPFIKEFEKLSDEVENYRNIEDKIKSSIVHNIYNTLMLENINSSRRIIYSIFSNKTHNVEKNQNYYILKNMINVENFIVDREINKNSLRNAYLNLTDSIEMKENTLDGQYYRQSSVYIGNKGKGVDSNKINEYMDDLILFINNNDDNIHYLIKTIIIHLYFEFIHPYYDFNGRMGRILAKWYAYYLGNDAIKNLMFFETALNYYREKYLSLFSEFNYIGIVDATYFVANIINILTKQKKHFLTTIKLDKYLEKNSFKKLSSLEKSLIMVDQAYRDTYEIKDDALIYFSKIKDKFKDYSNEMIYRTFHLLVEKNIFIKVDERNMRYKNNYAKLVN